MTATINYRKLDSDYARHHARFSAHVAREGLVCQECRGAGGEVDPVLDDGSGPFNSCGWCEGTGKVTKWLRGLWLRMKREEVAK